MRERGECGLNGENIVEDDDSLTDESTMGVDLLDDFFIQFIVYLL